MTFKEFKEECYLIRETRIVTDEIFKELFCCDRAKFEGLSCNVIDPSKERSDHKGDQEERLVNAIYDYDHKREVIVKKLESLPKCNGDVKDTLFDLKGVGGEVVFQYFVFGKDLEKIAKALEITSTKCYTLLKSHLKKAHIEFESKCNNTTLS